MNSGIFEEFHKFTSPTTTTIFILIKSIQICIFLQRKDFSDEIHLYPL